MVALSDAPNTQRCNARASSSSSTRACTHTCIRIRICTKRISHTSSRRSRQPPSMEHLEAAQYAYRLRTPTARAARQRSWPRQHETWPQSVGRQMQRRQQRRRDERAHLLASCQCVVRIAFALSLRTAWRRQRRSLRTWADHNAWLPRSRRNTVARRWRRRAAVVAQRLFHERQPAENIQPFVGVQARYPQQQQRA